MFFSLLFVHLFFGTAMFYFNSLLRSFCLPVLVALGVPSMDPELLAEDDADEVIVIAKAAGFVVSAEEIKTAQLAPQELSDEELEGVAGGVSMVKIECGHCM